MKVFKVVSASKLLSLMLLSLALMSSLSAPLTANAVSAYDDLLRTTPDLLLKTSASDPGVDISNSWYSIIKNTPVISTCTNSFKNSLDSALETGEWGISLYTGDISQPSTDPYTETYALVYWTDGVDGYNRFAGAAPDDYIQNIPGASFHQEALLYIRSDDPANSPVHVRCGRNSYTLIGTRPTNAVVPYEAKVFVSNFDTVYPPGYSGDLLPGVSSMDVDDDGLTVAQENILGTSNIKKDTDDDGLGDYIESQWNTDRDDIFCGAQCAYPDPTVKDVYVEMDWMKDASNNVYAPNSTQLDLVKDMFEDRDINLHVDTGQFGGGNELSVYTQPLPYTATANQIDFWDYKNGGDGVMANFSLDRDSIWRYMIYGYNYSEATSSSGWAETMGDDLFISGGLIDDMSGLSSLDRAIADTMAHEIGHSLCLSDDKVFEEQPDECVYGGIDNDDENDSEYNLENYESVMNYRYQLTNQDDLGVVDYSDGGHGLGDHDDWGAVALGMGGFSGTRTALGAEEIASNYYVTPDGSVIVEEASIEEMSPQQSQNQEQKSNDDPLMVNSAKSNTSDPDTGLPMDERRDGSTSPDWILLIVAGGIVALSTVTGALLYLKKRNK